jgi:hypothetical protein
MEAVLESPEKAVEALKRLIDFRMTFDGLVYETLTAATLEFTEAELRFPDDDEANTIFDSWAELILIGSDPNL